MTLEQLGTEVDEQFKSAARGEINWSDVEVDGKRLGDMTKEECLAAAERLEALGRGDGKSWAENSATEDDEDDEDD